MKHKIKTHRSVIYYITQELYKVFGYGRVIRTKKEKGVMVIMSRDPIADDFLIVQDGDYVVLYVTQVITASENLITRVRRPIMLVQYGDNMYRISSGLKKYIADPRILCEER